MHWLVELESNTHGDELKRRYITSCEQAWEDWKSFSGKFSLLARGCRGTPRVRLPLPGCPSSETESSETGLPLRFRRDLPSGGELPRLPNSPELALGTP